MPNWKLTTNAFPEISKAEWGQGVEELPHSWLTLLAWTQEFLTQKWHLETPLPRSKAQQRREESSKAPDLWKRKRLHKTWGIWDTFQATGVTKEIVKQHNGVFCVFLNYPEGTVSPQYILPTVHIPQSSSQLWCSLTHTWIRTGNKPGFQFYFSFMPLSKSLLNFNPCLAAHRKQTLEKWLLIQGVFGSTGLCLKSNYKSRESCS